MGRLDKDSEGLVILTDDGRLQNLIAHPKYNKTKNYIVQVDGEINQIALNSLQKGVHLIVQSLAFHENKSWACCHHCWATNALNNNKIQTE